MRKIYKFIFKTAIPRGAAVLTITSFASYVMGLFRDRIFAQTFGAGEELDAYNASFIVPDLLLNVFVAGALSAAFIPVFSGLLAKGKREEADELAGSVLNSAFFLMAGLGIFVFIFAPFVVPFIAPGFSEENRLRFVQLLRIMVLSPIIFAVSNTLGGMLVGFRRFLSYGLSPVFYNLGIIGGALFLTPFLGIYGVALGTIGGALLHLAVRIVGVIQNGGFRYTTRIRLNDTFKVVLRLMVPKMFGHPVELVTFWGFTVIASGLGPGNITVLNFARNFQSVPVSLFGIAFATSILPVLSELAERRDFQEYRNQFFKTFRGIFVLALGSAVFILFFRTVIIRLFLGGGAFGEEDVRLTALALAAFTPAIITESLDHLLARSFYALKNTVIPVTMSILGLGIAVSGGWILSKEFGVLAFPLAFFAGSLVKMSILFLLLHRRVKLF